ncbi:MAG: hypothetical protein A2X28_02075 [Elusimicrobia bacterium GWA2_56_46]|nr:MAG: hypothetical protein A2X28_02075 [Elusimicrobia bacterium GWA2_56_46]OGR55443.1 MAG: hypothetical protein A2X39_00890 [Elusimicrobia bacterium GWC2_56_31]HBW21909.1 hypothetical protein [Elusimicrobiota bacterium]
MLFTAKEATLFNFNWIIYFGVILAGLIVFWRFLNRPGWILCALALAVSFISVNIHIGFTFYVSRILMACLLIVALVRAKCDLRGGINWKINRNYLFLFAGTIFFQIISSLSAPSVSDSLRQMFIYLSMMAVFLSVLFLGVDVSGIIRAVYFYLAFSILQGLVGVYQVIGGLLGWPMYNDFLGQIPVGNPRNAQGIYWFPGEMVPRAFGFLSDVNHYAGYMVGVIVLAMALIAWNRKRIFPYLVLVSGFAGLMLSLSRSGMLTLGLFGIPALLLVLHRVRFSLRNLIRPTLLTGGMLILLLVVGGMRSGGSSIGNIIKGRFGSLTHPGAGERYHLLSRLMALDALATNPLIGVGMGVNSTPWYSERYDAYWAGAHSHHFDALGQTGLLGAGLQWLFMFLVGFRMWQGLLVGRRGSQESAILAGVLAAFIAIIFGNFFYYYYLNDFVWFLMGCGVALSNKIIFEARNNSAGLKQSEELSQSHL